MCAVGVLRGAGVPITKGLYWREPVKQESQLLGDYTEGSWGKKAKVVAAQKLRGNFSFL